ncbi:malonate decarboxylase subunit alpha [Cuneatibacter sp. NSJ-177]|uniref:acyl CoA:acetate/3-ketoacid CoA transferase n=1 Tax=Cuneatibacter sp. NSJ-177 TaxID=2931401 RepID=UPI001FD4DCA3|nr:malonate decarboxylase subunit alpha [Cuneatibacter sp. NSJ-177]MCJ7836130.1 malonate decarboxylase subunit alpha [Cuneatibacter sp. NSJ-177]
MSKLREKRRKSRVPVLSAAEAVQMIPSGAVVAFTGAGGGIVEPTELILALAERYRNTKAPQDLTLMAMTGLGDRGDRGLSPLAQEGLCRRAIIGHWGQSPRIAEMAERNEIEAYNYPQGVMCQMYRAAAAGQPGVLTHVGLHTFLDPRQKGAKLNDRTTEDMVSLTEIDGKEYLFYRAVCPDVSIIRASTADTEGYLTMEDEITPMDVYPLAEAAHNNGGLVIAQVHQLVKKGTLHPKRVVVPGYLVDAVVVVPDQPQLYGTPVSKFISGDLIADDSRQEALPLTERKVIARRALMEASPGDVGNLGVGIADGIGNVANEEKVGEFITLTTEHGAIGGVTLQGIAFGASVNMKAVIDSASQFDFYDGGGLDICYVSFAEVDQMGNVNVHRFNGKIMGTGGFVNISQNSRKIVFCGTLKSGGLRTKVGEGKIEILQEGRFVKLLPEVEEITFHAKEAVKSRKEVWYVTERAVFRMTETGIELCEIAPGLDMERDVIQHMGFRPQIAKQVKTMDARLFESQPMNLKQDWVKKYGELD